MPEIDGRTSVCGLIGNPVEHTMSPVIHNTLADREGRKLVYVPFPVEKGRLPAAVEGAFALNILGLNVTVPYKTEVLCCLTETEDMAAKIGAVNTLVRTKDGYKGYNTDMLGLYRAMRAENIRLEGEEVILLGAGGAARAVAFLCAEYGAERVYILNRSLPKAEQVADEVNGAFGKKFVFALETADYMRLPDRKYLAVQATSVGLYPDTEAAVITQRSFYEKIHTGFDLIYRPSKTKFMSCVEAAGGRAFHGLKMLLYQGITAYELWTGAAVPEEDISAVYEKMKKAMGINE